MRRLLAAALAASALSLAACSGGGQNQAASILPQSSTSSHHRLTKDLIGGGPSLSVSLSLSLFDAPLSGSGLVVNAGIESIALVDANGNYSTIAQYSSPNVVNLLSLQQTAMAIQAQVAADTYTTVQMVLDPATSQMTLSNGTVLPLFPNASGPVTVNTPLLATVQPNSSVSLTLDFNLVQSMYWQQNNVQVQPVIYGQVNAGALTGTVVNGSGQPVSGAVIVATDESGNVENVTKTGSDGTYTLHALSAGNFTLTVNNAYTNPIGWQFTATGNDAGFTPSPVNAIVTQGQTNTVPTITD